MRKRLVTLVLGIVVTFNLFGGMISYAADYTFDAKYYARKYPDVVAAVGEDPEALYNHYLTHGVLEGRYVSQAEESYYFSNGITKPKNEIENTEVEKPVQEAVTDKAVAPVYVPIEITPKYNTYVDVDKTNQVVTYFENGVMVIQGPCVTGNESAKHGTPTGTYTITQHMTNKYLIGPTWKSWVSYWMRFTDDGCGLHDATWRSTFGGDIYKTNGSHGCVNLQKDFAKQLFDYVDVGTIVYVH